MSAAAAAAAADDMSLAKPMDCCDRMGWNIRGMCCCNSRHPSFWNRRLFMSWMLTLGLAITFVIETQLAEPMTRDYVYASFPQRTDTGAVMIDEIYHIHHKKETYPDSALYLTILVFPIGSFLVYHAVWCGIGHDLHHSLLSYLQGLVVTVNLTQLCKLFGEYRPDWYDRCGFDPSTGKCTTTDDNGGIVTDGHYSFFSGHASTSFYCMMFMTCWMLAKSGMIECHRFDPERHIPSLVSTSQKESDRMSVVASHVMPSPHSLQPDWKDGYGETLTERRMFGIPFSFVLIVGPLLYWAAFIVNSRIVDNVHHIRDVVVGSIVGSTIAILWYHIYYRSPLSGFGGPHFCCHTHTHNVGGAGDAMKAVVNDTNGRNPIAIAMPIDYFLFKPATHLTNRMASAPSIHLSSPVAAVAAPASTTVTIASASVAAAAAPPQSAVVVISSAPPSLPPLQPVTPPITASPAAPTTTIAVAPPTAAIATAAAGPAGGNVSVDIKP